LIWSLATLPENFIIFRTVPHVDEYHKLKEFTNMILRGVVGRKTEDEIDEPCDMWYSGVKRKGQKARRRSSWDILLKIYINEIRKEHVSWIYMLGVGSCRCPFLIGNILPGFIRSRKNSYKLRDLLAFHEEFCHVELVRAYKI
jgi:hypothetical protein